MATITPIYLRKVDTASNSNKWYVIAALPDGRGLVGYGRWGAGGRWEVRDAEYRRRVEADKTNGGYDLIQGTAMPKETIDEMVASCERLLATRVSFGAGGSLSLTGGPQPGGRPAPRRAKGNVAIWICTAPPTP